MRSSSLSTLARITATAFLLACSGDGQLTSNSTPGGTGELPPPGDAPVANVAVSLASSSLNIGQTTQATATLLDAANNVLTGRTITWASSNTAAATVSSGGVVTAVAVGTATIRATSEGITGSSSTLTVTTVPIVPVASVQVAPANPSILTGATVQLSTTLRDANNNVLTGRTVTWASSNSAVARVSTAGLVTGVAAGTATITATSEGQNGSTVITVTLAPVASVSVSLAATTLAVGATTQATATLRDANNNVLTGRTVTWASTNTAVATVSSGGVVTAAAAGTTTFTATSGGVTGTSGTLTVTAAPPPPPPGNGEPVYNPSTQSLILQDNFDSYANIGAALNAYPHQRGTQWAQLTPGRTGNAVRLQYGSGAADDIVFGPEAMLGGVGSWNGTLPRKAGPYTHFFFTTWFRFSAGADPAQRDYSGVKGFMFWNPASERYQNAVNKWNQDGQTRGPKAANPDNATSGMNLYKTPDGRAPLFSTIANGQWHRFTIEIYAGNDPSGHWGEQYWIDGNLIYSDIDRHVGAGTVVDHYDYQYPISHWMVFGNFVNAGAVSAYFTFDVDDWMAWTP